MPESISTIGLKDEKYFELLPPENDERLGFEVFKLLEDVVKYKGDQDLPAKWSKFYALGKNRHWKNPKQTKNVSLVSANYLFAHRQRTVNLLTNNNPTFNISKAGSPEIPEETYDALLKTCEHWWTETEQQHALEKSVLNGETYGIAIEKSIFNPDAEFGLGEVETEIIDPFYFGVYPTSCKEIQKAEAVLHFRPMSIREAQRRYPEHADQIRADEDVLKDLGDQRKEIASARSDKTGYMTSISGAIKHILNTAGTAQEGSEETLIVECWCRDYSTKKIEENGQEIDYPKYQGFIRCVTICSGGHVVLSDRSNPSINPELPEDQAIRTWLYDKYPFSMNPSVTDTGTIWGSSDYEQLESLQLELNKIVSSITTWSAKASRLKIINPKTSGVPNAHLTNAPGILNPSTMNHGISYLQPPPVPSDLLAFKDLFKDLFFTIAGSFELEQASTPGREVIAYRAIAALIEQATTMMRGKVRNYGKMIRERGRMYVSHVQNWYTEDRWIVYQDDVGQEQSILVNGRDLIIPAKLTIVSGSTMPRSQVQEREEAMTLQKQGVIDNEELLKKLDWPGWRNVVKRMKTGPIGSFLEMAAKAGVPQPFIQYLQQLSQMDEKAVEKGEIPPFQSVMAQIVPGLQQPQQTMEEQLEAAKLQAEIQKIQAETNLTNEKAKTEQIVQAVKGSGVKFDQEKLKIERARTVHDITSNKGSDVPGTFEATQKGTQQGPYIERGLQSNNEEVQ